MRKKYRWLIQTLVLSVALNGVLVALFFYFFIRDYPLYFSFNPKKALIETAPIDPSFLGEFQTHSFEHLVDLLTDTRPVEPGYRVCDFALGALVTFYDFDVYP